MAADTTKARNAMRLISQTSLDGVTEQLFTLGEIPGVLWTPEDAHGTRPLILMGHGGGQHKKEPGILARARRFAAGGGFAVAAIDVPSYGERPTDEEFDRLAAEYRARVAAGEDTAAPDTAMYALLAGQTVAEWRAVLTAVQQLGHVGGGPVGYWGVSAEKTLHANPRQARGPAAVRDGQLAAVLRPPSGLIPALPTRPPPLLTRSQQQCPPSRENSSPRRSATTAAARSRRTSRQVRPRQSSSRVTVS
ncbi:MAG: hypothetical protein ACRDPY_35345 [Streptosporangiaceae bacterium]